MQIIRQFITQVKSRHTFSIHPSLQQVVYGDNKIVPMHGISENRKLSNRNIYILYTCLVCKHFILASLIAGQ